VANKGKDTSNFIIQGSILAIASVLVRLIGIVYRIPLTNILGDGISVYSSAYSIYSLIWMIASFGIPTTVSRMVAERNAKKNYKEANGVFKTALLFATVVGGLAAAFLFFGSTFLANTVLQMPEIKYSLMILAPTVWISAYMGAFRGYYQGLGTMIPTACSQIVEQIINALASVIGAWSLWHYGQKIDVVSGEDSWAHAYGAAGASIGTASGALAGLLVCMFIYSLYRPSMKKQERKDRSGLNPSYPSLMKVLILTMIPITLNSAIYNISSLIDNSVFGNYTVWAGIHDQYKALWSAYEGKYHLLTHVPLAFATALSASAVPNLSKTLALGSMEDAVTKIQAALRFAMLVAIPSCVGLGVLASPIMDLLFHGTANTNELAAFLLQMGGITVVMYTFSTITNGILQGIGKVSTPAKNAAIALVGHVIVLVICLWVFRLDIYGVVIADIVFGLFMNILNYISIRKTIAFRMGWKKMFILPAISAVIMGIVTFGVYRLLMMLTHHNVVATILSIVVAVLVYALALLLTRAMGKEDLARFPKGDKLVNIAVKLHLMK
jgi:stage V sporulation protein B